MSEVNCAVENSKALTVGSVFELRCPADDQAWTGISPDKVALKLSEADKYKLQLLKFSYSAKNEALLTVTSYKPGSHNLVGVQLVSADHVVNLAPVQFAVVSVMDPQTPQEDPYGALGPIKLGLPMWYWLSLAMVIVFVAGLVWYRLWKRRRKKKLLAKMRIFETAQTPYFQFHHRLRKIHRSLSFFEEKTMDEATKAAAMKELDEAYRIYLARTFLIPTMDWSEKQILSDLNKNHRAVYREGLSHFKKSFAELGRAQTALSEKQSQLALKDIEQILKMIREHIDEVERLHLRQEGKS